MRPEILNRIIDRCRERFPELLEPLTVETFLWCVLHPNIFMYDGEEVWRKSLQDFCSREEINIADLVEFTDAYIRKNRLDFYAFDDIDIDELIRSFGDRSNAELFFQAFFRNTLKKSKLWQEFKPGSPPEEMPDFGPDETGGKADPAFENILKKWLEMREESEDVPQKDAGDIGEADVTDESDTFEEYTDPFERFKKKMTESPACIGKETVLTSLFDDVNEYMQKGCDGVKTFTVVARSSEEAAEFARVLAEGLHELRSGTVHELDSSMFYDRPGSDVLFGDPPSYQSAAPGLLTNFFREDESSIVVFTDIESMYQVGGQQKLASTIKSGKLFDCNAKINAKKWVPAQNTVIIVTTTFGSRFCDRSLAGSFLNNKLSLRQEISSCHDNDNGINPILLDALFEKYVAVLPEITSKDIIGAADYAINELRNKYRDKQLYFSEAALSVIYGSCTGETSLPNARNNVYLKLDGIITDTLGDEPRANEFYFEADKSSVSDERIKKIFAGQQVNIGIVSNHPVYSADTGIDSEINTEYIVSADDGKKYDIIVYDYKNTDKGRYLSYLDLPCLQSAVLKVHAEAANYALIDYDAFEEEDTFNRKGICCCFPDTVQEEVEKAIYSRKKELAVAPLFNSVHTLTYSYVRQYHTAKRVKKVDIVLNNIKIRPVASLSEVDDGMVLESPDIKFKDVIGNSEAVAELKAISERIKSGAVSEYDLNAVALAGPPGTGKTLLAGALAGEMSAVFLNVDGSRLTGPLGAQHVRKAFETARRYKNAVVYIDEVESIASVRSLTSESSVLTTLLTELDGFKDKGNRENKTVFLCSTNLPEKLDPAFRRRLRIIDCPLPNADAIEDFLVREIAGNDKFKVAKDDIGSFAELCEGMSLALVKQIINLAYRISERRTAGKRKPSAAVISDLYDAFEMQVTASGGAQEEGCSEVVAVHEAGHLLVSILLGIEVQLVSVCGGETNGGFVKTGNQSLPGENDMRGHIKICLAGQAAEKIVLGATSTGCSADLKKAVSAAETMISCGMVESEDGMYIYSCSEKEKNDAVNRIINESRCEAEEMIRSNIPLLLDFKGKLMAKKRLMPGEISRIVAKYEPLTGKK